MNIGTILISISFLLALVAIVLYIQFFLNKNQKFRYYAKIIILVCSLFTTLSFLLLLYYFLTSNFNINYVWLYSGKNLKWYYKLSGVWAGQEGSLLLWTWLMLIPLAIEILLRNKKEPKVDEKKAKKKSKRKKKTEIKIEFLDWTFIIILVVIIVFLLLLLIKSPFADVSPIDLKYYPNGRGLNPTLRNIWMVIHPPLLFIGYALVVIPFSASMSYLITNDKNWTKFSLQWSRIAWLFLTLGIGVGAVWAYIELSYGGYWAWDPVEVGSLIPWVTLTAFLHAQLINQRNDRYKNIIPLLGMFTFLLVLFATFITRSGIWESVHSYQNSELVDILAGLNVISLILGVFMICILLFGMMFIIKRFSEEVEKEEKYTWDNYSMLANIVLLILLATIMFIGIIASRGESNPIFYETRLIPFAMVLFTILGICTIWRIFGEKNTKKAILLILLISLVCVFILPKFAFPGKSESFYGKISSHHIVAFFIPILFFSIYSIIYKIIKSLKLKSNKAKIKTISTQIIHFGIVLIVLSYCISQKMSEEKIINLERGKSDDFKEFEIKFVGVKNSLKGNEYLFSLILNYTQFLKNGNVSKELIDAFKNFNYQISNNSRITKIDEKNWEIADGLKKYKIEKTKIKLNIYGFEYYYDFILEISENGKLVEIVKPKWIFYDDIKAWQTNVHVKHFIKEDLYIYVPIPTKYDILTPLNNEELNNLYEEGIEVNIKTIPFMNFLWGGMIIMAGGIIIRIFVDYRKFK